MPQLDGLRTFAVMGVFFAHWGIGSLPGFSFFPWGDMGVTLFFVLSGYLITGILTSAGDRVAAGEESYLHAARQFYVRRCLRIFPIYYLVLLGAAVLILQVRQAFWWHLTYASNVYFAIRGNLDVQGSTFWTLASEEQFYLIWPWVILAISRARRRSVVIVTLGVGVAARLGLSMFPVTQMAAKVLLPGCLPFFALGALLAIRRETSDAPDAMRHGKDDSGAGPDPALTAIIGLLLFLLARKNWGPSWLGGAMDTLGSLGWGLTSMWIIGKASSGFGGSAGRILEARWVRYLGRISYGLYIYHPFVTWAIIRILMLWGITAGDHLAVFSPVFAITTIGVATLSWFAIEQPVNRLKRHFPY